MASAQITEFKTIATEELINVGDNTFSVDLPELSEGMYYIRMQTEEKVTNTPFLIQRN
jgi:hypothetical protein